MPIRLLYFEPHGSDIRISLVERDFIYAHLESQLRANVNVANYLKLAGQEAEEQANQWLMAKHAKYAILSHTWLRTVPGEITYGDWIKERGPFDAESLGYKKLVNFCRTAWKVHGFTFGWIDTICINKESSSELDESIRSMYNWYARSQLCIVYLAETQILANMHVDPWFTRGWTLQELLAPRTIKFYGRKWHPLFEGSDNDKTVYQIMKQIEKASTISSDELDDIRAAPISRRMQLAAVREVTREEDTAYSLMGIFNVSIMTAYGEGAKRAFFRLLQEILTSSFDILDLLNCAGRWDPHRAHPSGMLPTNPQWYLKRSTHPDLSLGIPIKPLLLTHLGLRVPVILMPALSASSQSPYSPIGDFSATVNIKPVEPNLYHSFYNVLDKKITNIDGPNPNVPGSSQITLAVVNFKQAVEDESEPGSIVIPETCFAIPIECLQTMERVVIGWDFDIRGIEIHEPIVFHLKTKNRRGSREVHRDRLKEHGMHLVSVYM
ncbi:hypothetical protein BDN70DRAFT_325292 [Pholiota conissans]|uniref:Heterokaryon incompatibility domain-containing protein n=1 Tax=Pholiota conissans TaxID=109636 RepID=A0A9P5YQZ8_9AGAR|nr:hypothetical protein BDN70DRAFT_325292 [Pholiota conissans]